MKQTIILKWLLRRLSCSILSGRSHHQRLLCFSQLVFQLLNFLNLLLRKQDTLVFVCLNSNRHFFMKVDAIFIQEVTTLKSKLAWLMPESAFPFFYFVALVAVFAHWSLLIAVSFASKRVLRWNSFHWRLFLLWKRLVNLALDRIKYLFSKNMSQITT